MESSIAKVHILGISDSFVFELIETILTLGKQPILISVEDLTGGAPPVSAEKYELGTIASMHKSDAVFTGAELHPNMASDSFPKQVMFSMHKLIQLQELNGLTNWVNLVHPLAWLSPSANLGRDIYIGANSSIGANSKIGPHMRINRNVSIGHDVVIGRGTEIAPCAAISSGAKIGNWCFIGAGAVVLNGIEIGDNAIVGAGSVVTRNVTAGSTVFGFPAGRNSG